MLKSLMLTSEEHNQFLGLPWEERRGYLIMISDDPTFETDWVQEEIEAYEEDEMDRELWYAGGWPVLQEEDTPEEVHEDRLESEAREMKLEEKSRHARRREQKEIAKKRISNKFAQIFDYTPKTKQEAIKVFRWYRRECLDDLKMAWKKQRHEATSEPFQLANPQKPGISRQAKKLQQRIRKGRNELKELRQSLLQFSGNACDRDALLLIWDRTEYRIARLERQLARLQEKIRGNKFHRRFDRKLNSIFNDFPTEEVDDYLIGCSPEDEYDWEGIYNFMNLRHHLPF
jgi:hypothetical protein